MSARRTEAETFRAVPAEDGSWRQMAARPPRVIRRDASAPSGLSASRGVAVAVFGHTGLGMLK